MYLLVTQLQPEYLIIVSTHAYNDTHTKLL